MSTCVSLLTDKGVSGEFWFHLLGIWQEFVIGLGQGSRFKKNTAEECVLCIWMGLVKTLNTLLCLRTDHILCMYLE